MSSPVCDICGICPGQIYPELSSFLPYPICCCCLEPTSGGNGNWRHMGRPSHLPAFSVEFEITSYSSRERNRALALLPLGYLRTYDPTVSDEYKSPIYHSLSMFRLHLPILDTLQDLVSDSCGTHLHVSLPAPLQQRLTSTRGDVFGPLVDYLTHNEDETAWFWGRKTCTYANRNLDASYPCIRTQSRYDTIEFRLPRFQNAAQYLEVVRFCRGVIYSLHRSLTASVGEPWGAQSPKQLGYDVLHLYQATVKRHSAWVNHRAIPHYQQFVSGMSAPLSLVSTRL